MKKCKTCKYWTKADDEGNWGANRICNPVDPDTYEPMPTEFEVRICKSPKIVYFERQVESDGISVIDGSCYYAKLLTAENFGCANHEAV